MGFYKVLRKGTGSWIAVWGAGWGCDVEPGQVAAGIWPQALKQAHWNLDVAAASHRRQHGLCSGRHGCPWLHSPAALPCAQATLQHHSQLHVLTSLLIQLKTPSAPSQAGSLCTRCGAMLQPVLAVTGGDGERQKGACSTQQTPAQQPHRGRNILASVIDGLDIAFRQSLPSQISPCY